MRIFIFIVLLTFILPVIPLWEAIGQVRKSTSPKQETMVNYHDSTGLTEIAPVSFIENSFLSSNIKSDTVLPSLIKRKGYPDVGMIFITTISNSPILDSWNMRSPKRVTFYLENERIRPRISLLNYEDKNEEYTETFVLLFNRTDLEKLIESDKAYFRINSTQFKINDAVKTQLKEILDQ